MELIINLVRSIILLALGMSLSSCFIAPGMRMSVPAESRGRQAPNDIKPIFIPITVSLVRKMGHYPSLNYHNNSYHYRVGAYDILNIHVWDHPEFASPLGQPPSEQSVNAPLNPVISPVGFLVGADGDIYFPLVGYVRVEGKTTEQIRTTLSRSLRKYVRNPQMDVRVSGFRSRKIYVMGEVYKPGLQPITDTPMSITDAINLAGGMMPDSADPSHIFVIRGDYARPDVYWLNAQSPTALLLGENFHLQAHDVVFVSTAGISRWNRAINQILPSVQTVWFTANLIRYSRGT